MPQLYCGNNANDPGLQSGEKILGTRYECLRKGIGVGLHLPYDDMYARNDYQPIDSTKIYCGNSKVLTGDYDRFGNLIHCFQKGVGVGRRKKAINTISSQTSYNTPRSSISSSFSSSFSTPHNNNNDSTPYYTPPTSPYYSPLQQHSLNWKYIFLTTITGSILIFILLYFLKPKYTLKTDDKKSKEISWSRFFIMYILLVTGWFIVSFLIHLAVRV